MLNEVAAARASTILRSQFGRLDELHRLELGESNDVWTAGDVVLRVARRPGSSDLLAEADIADRLDPAVGYPAVLGRGQHDGHEWMAMQRLPGDNLAAVWPALAARERARAISDLWSRLIAVHGTDTQLEPDGLALLKPLVQNQVASSDGMLRLRAYAVLRDTWAVSKWIASAPERRNIDEWGPVRNLRAHAAGSSWPSHLIA